MNLLRKEVVIPVIAIVVAIAVIVGLLALKNSILNASELSACGTDNANAEDEEMTTPTSYDIVTPTYHMSNDAVPPSADMQSPGNHENDTIGYDYSMLEYDEVYVPGYSVPLKIGMSQEEFLNNFSDYAKNQGNELYTLDSQEDIIVWISDNVIIAIIIGTNECFSCHGILVGSTAEQVYDILGDPPIDGGQLIYYYDSNGNLTDHENVVLLASFSIIDNSVMRITLSQS